MFYARLKRILTGLAIATALTSTFTIAETRYYPTGNQTPIEVGNEEYVDKNSSLTGLEGVHVISKYVLSSAEKYNLDDMPKDLILQIRQRFEAAGLRMLSAEEVKNTPGQPTLTFYPAYSGNEIDAIKATENPDSVTANPSTKTTEHDCCRSSTWASFQQSASTLRNPNKHYLLSTWGSGEDTDACEGRGVWTYAAVLKTIDKFVGDYQAAQSEHTPVLVSQSTDTPENCEQVWLMNMNVFETNRTTISEVVKPVLDRLVKTANLCKQYNYVIETHSDTRADAAYNKALSETRAQAVKDYLLRKNINFARLKTIAFGESKPLNQGTSEQDHAANRRVVIIPQLGQI